MRGLGDGIENAEPTLVGHVAAAELVRVCTDDGCELVDSLLGSERDGDIERRA
jgi:hypothetical protein